MNRPLGKGPELGCSPEGIRMYTQKELLRWLHGAAALCMYMYSRYFAKPKHSTLRYMAKRPVSGVTNARELGSEAERHKKHASDFNAKNHASMRRNVIGFQGPKSSTILNDA